MRMLSKASTWLVLLLAAVATLPTAAAQFTAVAGQESVPLIAGKDGSGTITFAEATVRQELAGGRLRPVLAVPVQVDNRSRKDLLLKRLDLWAVTAQGTVLSQPELRQDGILVWRAEVNARQTSSLEAVFHLQGAGAFDSFRLHWGGQVAYRPRSGEVTFTAAAGQGYRPAPAAADTGETASFDAEAFEYELVHPGADEGIAADPYGWGQAGFHVSVGFGFIYGDPWYWSFYPWYGYPYYPYYPVYPVHPCYNCGEGGSSRQVKEDAVLGRATGQDGPGTTSGGVQRVDVSQARSREGSSGMGASATTVGGSTLSGRAANGQATVSSTGASRVATTTRTAGRSRTTTSATVRGGGRRPVSLRGNSAGSRRSSAVGSSRSASRASSRGVVGSRTGSSRRAPAGPSMRGRSAGGSRSAGARPSSGGRSGSGRGRGR